MKNKEVVNKPVSEPTKEMVDHPQHYQGNGIEVIDVIESFGLGFCLGNAIKYILRCGKKDDPLQELKKARWYINREIAVREAMTVKE